MPYIGQKPHNKVVTASEITDGIITADKLASDSVTTAKIADNGVTTAKINADAVTDAKVADDVIGTEHLTAGEVDTTALGADAVTAAKIADNAISEEHLDATVVTGLTELAATPADTDEFLISDAGTLKRIDFSHIKGGGKVLQVVSGTDNTQRSASSSNMSHGNSTAIATLTPSATSSKVLVIANTTVGKSGGSNNYSIFRDNSVNLATNQMFRSDGDNSGLMFSAAFLDSPNTTSEINYRIKWTVSTGTGYIGYDSTLTSVIAIEIGA
jgi:hypothetical protein